MTSTPKTPLDFNPLWAGQDTQGNKGHIEPAQGEPNIPWQNRLRPPTNYENTLGDALEHVFEGGATNLEEVVAALNASAFKTPEGQAWTAQRYEDELARLDKAAL